MKKNLMKRESEKSLTYYDEIPLEKFQDIVRSASQEKLEKILSLLTNEKRKLILRMAMQDE